MKNPRFRFELATPVPVIDLFAGPGGLGEGFASVRTAGGSAAFRLALSVEKDPIAHQTLELRAFYRQFQDGSAPDAYYDFARGILSREELFGCFTKEADRARREALCAELGPASRKKLGVRVREALEGTSRSVLIGGPPCQAYSLVGRSRNRGIVDYDADKDARHTLYVEYLHVLASQWPAVFVMENVKGLLSARFENESMFNRILRDLRDPATAIGRRKRSSDRCGDRHGASSGPPYTYRLLPLAKYDERQRDLFGSVDRESAEPRDFVVRAERHGVPQARHRVILLGVRSDVEIPEDVGLLLSPAPSVEDVIGSLPQLRSGISREDDGPENWSRVVADGIRSKWFSTLKAKSPNVSRAMQLAVAMVEKASLSRGGEALPGSEEDPQALAEWYAAKSTPATLNHATRAHIAGDLHRYLFASAFARVNGRSPTLADFPRALLPKHKNARNAVDGTLFNDRFRVQLQSSPSTTITSHISKDGHYYIHYDPAQCRSLTVREAARLQTFPDNYFFCGTRTAQYHQVGNAVPPFLASQVAEVVATILQFDDEVKRKRNG